MQQTSSRRNAFTLIELLVVIAIIAILTALLTAGVMAVMSKGPEVQTRNDILQLSQALQNFQGKYKFYPPSRLKLCSTYSQYNPALPLDVQSLQAINAMWPNLADTNPATLQKYWTNVPWSGAVLPPGGLTLDGDQCLVFFLGGIPNGVNSPVGFSTSPTNPAAVGGDRIKFMEFPAGRLVFRNAASPFPSFVDGFKKQPYVYFSPGKSTLYDPTPINIAATAFAPAHQVSPYVQQLAPAVKYWNANSFQIISAGANGQFGQGGTVSTIPSIVQQVWPSVNPPAGMDDMTNFNSSKLGAPD